MSEQGEPPESNLGNERQLEVLLPGAERLRRAIELMRRNGTDALTRSAYSTIVNLVGSKPKDGVVRRIPTKLAHALEEENETFIRLGPPYKSQVASSLWEMQFEQRPGFYIHHLPVVQFSSDHFPTISLSLDSHLRAWLQLKTGRKYMRFPEVEDYTFIDDPTRRVFNGRLDPYENVAYDAFIVPGNEGTAGNMYSVFYFPFNEDLEAGTDINPRILSDQLKQRVIEAYSTAMAHSKGEDVAPQWQMRNPDFPQPDDIDELLLSIRTGMAVRKKTKHIGRIGLAIRRIARKPPSPLLPSPR